jgi:Pyridoxal-dependent decarboxylase, C-terminal sheet domain
MSKFNGVDEFIDETQILANMDRARTTEQLPASAEYAQTQVIIKQGSCRSSSKLRRAGRRSSPSQRTRRPACAVLHPHTRSCHLCRRDRDIFAYAFPESPTGCHHRAGALSRGRCRPLALRGLTDWKKIAARRQTLGLLDTSRYNGLPETQCERIHYRIHAPLPGLPSAPAILAGPTCDSTDIIYEHASYELPLNLAVGDPIDFLSPGPYTANYASVKFNGFSPIRTYPI